MGIATVVGGWAYLDAQRNAAERFDLSLLATALAISRDMVASGGDALSEETRDLLRDTSGGAVFYHVYAPDGVFVTGYATPPVPPGDGRLDDAQVYYDASYLGERIRALRFSQQATIDGVEGLFTFSVWQNTTVRDGYVRSRTRPVFAIIATMIGALAFVVWFGVARGLAPLTNLEDAIARRSVDDLSPIRRTIPQEVSGIVGRLNTLLSELSASIEAKDAFISNAAHQLRNPIAGVLTLANSVGHAKDLSAARTRAEDLLEAAQEVADLTNSLLALERAKATVFDESSDIFAAGPILENLAERMKATARASGIGFAAPALEATCVVQGDPVMFEQAVLNVLNNALVHGGPGLSEIRLTAKFAASTLTISVLDDGKGIAPEDYQDALGRFSQIGPSAGSGLGLPIAAASLASFGGTIEFDQADRFFEVRMKFPARPRSNAAE